jgi:predicted permease
MREWWAKVCALFRRNDLDADLRDEIDAHLGMELEARLERGMRPQEALEAATRAFGNRTLIREASREAWMFRWLEAVLQDVRYALRLFRRRRGFALTAVSTMALGIGATTAAFTLLDHVLLRPLPFREPDRLVMLHQTDLADGGSRELVSPPNLLDWRASSMSFESMGAYLAAFLPVNLSGQGNPLRLDSTLADSVLFETLGVRPAAGRLFTAEDDRLGAANVVLLSNHLAVALFGGVTDAVGRTLSLDNQAYTVAGVMPQEFAFPRPETALWRPLRLTMPALLANRSNHVLMAVGRLRAGVTIDEARAEMSVRAEQLQRAYPGDNAKTGIAVAGLRDIMSPQSRMLILAVFGAAFCLTLIACTNLANLLFARAMVRRQEMAVRIAIGVARGRLLQQLLTESLVLAAVGGAVGAVLAATTTPLLARLVPNGLPIGGAPEIDVRVLAFAALLTLCTSLVFGIGPALRSCRVPDLNAFRSQSATGGRTAHLRSVLVVAEVVGSVMLLVAAGLLVKALWRVQALDPGFRTEGVLTLRTALPMPKYGDATARRRFYARVLTGARALPGVTSAAYASYHPMEGFSGRFAVLVPGVFDDPQTAPGAVIHFVTGDFFTTLGIPLRRGRPLTDHEDAAAQPVVVISESLANTLWSGQDPIGRRVRVAGDRIVVGVAGNIAVRRLEGVGEHQVYFPFEQLGTTSTYYAPKDLLVHTAGEPDALVSAVRTIIHDADPEQAVSDIRLLDDIVAAQTAPRRDQLLVLGTFTAIACLLAAVGIHGLLSFTVSARTQEIGVRVALGAARRDILRMFLRQGLMLGAAGVLIALPLAYVAARSMRALLFGVDPDDAVIYGSASLLAMITTLASSFRPAFRASTIDPALTIRMD